MLPEVNVGAADARCADVHQALVRTEFGDLAFHYPQVMVGVGVDCEVLGLVLDNVHFFKLLSSS